MDRACSEFGQRLDRNEKCRFSELIFILVLKAKFGAACNNHKEIEDNSGDDLQKFLNDFSRQASEMEGMVISHATSWWSAESKCKQKPLSVIS